MLHLFSSLPSPDPHMGASCRGAQLCAPYGGMFVPPHYSLLLFFNFDFLWGRSGVWLLLALHIGDEGVNLLI